MITGNRVGVRDLSHRSILLDTPKLKEGEYYVVSDNVFGSEQRRTEVYGVDLLL